MQHVPILRHARVLSFRGYASTTATKTGQEIPFFMLPSVGGGSSLRGFASWRFRDRNSLLLQAEWRSATPAKCRRTRGPSLLDSWIEQKRKDDTIDELFAHWILGQDSVPKKPRWSVLDSLLK